MGNLAPSPKSPRFSYKSLRVSGAGGPFLERSLGFPEHTGCWVGAVFVSNMNNPSLALTLKFRVRVPGPTLPCFSLKAASKLGTMCIRAWRD